MPTRIRSNSARVAVCAALVLTSNCSVGSNDPADARRRLAAKSPEVVVAVAWPWQARQEVLFPQGLEMALAEINESGGIGNRPLKLLRMDDQESVNEGRMVAQQLADDPAVMAVIGHLQSHVTVPAAAIYDLAGLVLVAPAATSADLTSAGYRRVFRATFTDGAVGAQLAQYALDQGYRRVAIYYVRTIYGRALANAFEEAFSGAGGAQVVARDSYDPSQELGGETLGPVLSRWRQVEVDAIFLAGEVPSAGRLLRVIRREGVETAIIGGDAMSSPTLLQEAAGAAEGIVVACFFHPDEPRPEVARFNETFRARYGTIPDGGAALGYDVLRLLADALRKAESPAPEHVAEVLHQVEGWPGVTGSFTFDEKGDLLDRRIPMCVVRDGSFRYLPRSDDQGQEER